MIWARLDFRLSFFRNSLFPSCYFPDYMPLIHSWWSAWSCVMWLIKFDKACVCRRFWLIGSYCEEGARPFRARANLVSREQVESDNLHFAEHGKTDVCVHESGFYAVKAQHFTYNSPLFTSNVTFIICLKVWAVW